MRGQREEQPYYPQRDLGQNRGGEGAEANKGEDPSHKYNFSSYHMNIISNNRDVQGLSGAPQQYQSQGPEHPGYHNQPQMYQPQAPMYQPPPQYVNNDVQMLLNNMYMVLNNQSKLLGYLIEKNDHNYNTTNKIYDEIKTIK